MNLFWMAVTGLVIAFMVALVIPSDAEKYRWEGYPWPSYAGKPSREKPMRRDLGEPLEFGEMYPEAGSKPVTRAPKAAKTVPKPSKPVTKSAKASKSVTPPLPVPRPPWYQRILPTKPVPPPRPLPQMENVDPVPPPPAVVAEEGFDTELFAKWITIFGLILLAIMGAVWWRSR
jgi:hypothetical protein